MLRFLFLPFCFVLINAFAQNPKQAGKTTDKTDVNDTSVKHIRIEKPVFTKVEEMPEFPGGEDALNEFIRLKTVYPKRAIQNKVQGKVIVSFTIHKDGKIINPKVTQGVGFGCDEEAIRVVNSMPMWKPGKHEGQAVDVSYSLPINFRLL